MTTECSISYVWTFNNVLSRRWSSIIIHSKIQLVYCLLAIHSDKSRWFERWIYSRGISMTGKIHKIKCAEARIEISNRSHQTDFSNFHISFGNCQLEWGSERELMIAKLCFYSFWLIFISSMAFRTRYTGQSPLSPSACNGRFTPVGT